MALLVDLRQLCEESDNTEAACSGNTEADDSSTEAAGSSTGTAA